MGDNEALRATKEPNRTLMISGEHGNLLLIFRQIKWNGQLQYTFIQMKFVFIESTTFELNQNGSNPFRVGVKARV